MKTINNYIIEKLVINKDSSNKNEKRDKYNAREYQVGDIICAVYEWNSRHVHFFKIIGFKGKATVEAIELGKKLVSGDWQNGECVPDETKADKNAETYRINNKGRLKIKDYFCYLWDGTPESYYTD